jgi:DNA-binding XRE family transcriptional regulator
MADAQLGITAAQSRMARAGVGWSVTETSKVSQVSRSSIIRFENGNDIRPVLKNALRAAFESSGVIFTDNGIQLPASGMAA